MVERTNGRLIGWGAYVPAQVVTNDDLARRLDTSDEWIVQRSGIRERRIAGPGETTASMATAAGRAALHRAGIGADELDLIVVANSSPDYFTPPVSSQVQHALGAAGVPAFVVETGCTGFVYALATAYQFIETGAYRTVMVIGVEMLSRHINWEDRATCVLFGDAAGALILRATDERCGLRAFVLGSDGSMAGSIIIPAGGTAEPMTPSALAEGRQYVHMNGREVFRFATRVVGEVVRETAARAGVGLEAIDWIIPHQANLRIIQAAARDLAIAEEKWVVNIDRYANTSAASIPLALSERLDAGTIALDETLMLVSFGAGLTWGAVLLKPGPHEG